MIFIDNSLQETLFNLKMKGLKFMIHQNNDISKNYTQCLYPVFINKPICKNLIDIMGFDLEKIVNKEKGKITKVFTLGKLSDPNHIKADELIFIGLGEQNKIDSKSLRDVFGNLSSLIKGDALLMLDRAVTSNIDVQRLAYLFTESFYLSRYRYIELHEEINITIRSKTAVSDTINQAEIIAKAVNQARTLGNKPSNLLTPNDLANHALKLADELNLECSILSKEDLIKLKTGALLGVNQGSSNEAKMITLKYQGASNEPFTALIGKGLTFDSGGYNLKQPASMLGMKYDMCGAANVLSALEIIARLKQKANILVVIPTTENLISGNAYKCNDVLTSLSGKTIEVTNTDAEGRLILCDAITYAISLGAKRIIDIATLTGACHTALDKEFTGGFTNNQAFYESFKASCEYNDEPLWQLPITEGFINSLKKSKVADLVNAIPGAGGGASLGASFLHEFVESKVEWIHLDIASTSTTDKDLPTSPVGATGVMVRSLAYFFTSNLKI